ncbi:Uncharacterised protein [Mycobacteroides abscessus subsp. abscessus]|nr:Uncharacterised protein [Mycobacteroides abscessus subsp. abscessus]
MQERLAVEWVGRGAALADTAIEIDRVVPEGVEPLTHAQIGDLFGLVPVVQVCARLRFIETAPMVAAGMAARRADVAPLVHVPPLGIAVERAADARTLGGMAPPGALQPALAVLAGHAQLQQRVTRPGVVHIQPVTHPVNLISGEADPLLGEHITRHRCRMRVAQQLAHLDLDRLELVLAGALATAHAVPFSGSG